MRPARYLLLAASATVATAIAVPRTTSGRATATTTASPRLLLSSARARAGATANWASARRARPFADAAAPVLADAAATTTATPPAAPRKRSRRFQMYSLLAGGVAGIVASTLTCPIEVVKTQLQSTSMAGSGPLEVARAVYAGGGAAGFWTGMRPTLVGIIPSRASYFWAYSSTKAWLGPKLGADSPLTHLVSAVAAGVTGNTLSA